MDLERGEHTIFEGHPSWRSILGFYLKGLVIAALCGAIAYVALDLGTAVLVALVVIVIALVAGYVKRLFTTYTITNHRLHIRRGIVARAEQQTQCGGHDPSLVTRAAKSRGLDERWVAARRFLQPAGRPRIYSPHGA